MKRTLNEIRAAFDVIFQAIDESKHTDRAKDILANKLNEIDEAL